MAEEKPSTSWMLPQQPMAPVEMSQAVVPQGPQTERCLIGNHELSLPIPLIEDYDVFSEILSQNTWQKLLTDSQRRHLLKFLPTFPQNDVLEKQQTLRQLFGGQNFKFGNPLQQFHDLLKDGMFSPDIAKYSTLYKKAKLKEYRHQQHIYYTKLLKDILINRKEILAAVYKSPMEEPLKLDLMKYEPPAKDKSIQHKVSKRYAKIMQEVSKECGDLTSSDEEDYRSASGPAKSRKQLFKSPLPDSPTEGPSSNVLPTLAPKPQFVNGETAAVQVRSQSPIQITDDDYRKIISGHRKRRLEGEQSPDLDVRNLTLQDIIMRTQPAKKMMARKEQGSPTAKKKMKDKGEKRKKKMKVKDMEAEGIVMAPSPPAAMLPPGVEMAVNEAVSDRMQAETLDAVASLKQESASEQMTMASEAYAASQVAAPQPVVNLTSASTVVPQATTVVTSGGVTLHSNFFSVLRDFICEETEQKTSTMKLEEKIREWQEGPYSCLCPWYSLQPNWIELVLPALKFLSGDVLGLSLDNFIPYIDYKERAQHWKWIGLGRDTDDNMMPLFKHWLENKDDMNLETSDRNSASPPPPKTRTSFIVRPTTEEEKSLYREQEMDRFINPHKSYTYILHGYESVVGPVKGVYSKESAMNKAREHALLVKDRPSYVTILTLVRDAAARLPNGEGTRSDICELLKDSQFVSPGVTDAQINTVVSGALDRLHYEKDPCVKYDVNRKVWIYLHRNRTEEEFEMIHQAQGAAAKAKKALQKPKPSKKIKEHTSANQTSPKAAASVASHLNTSASSDVNIETSSLPGSIPASPRTPMQTSSPRTPQVSPRATTPQMSPRASPKVMSSLAQHMQASPRTQHATTMQIQGSPKGSATVAQVGSPKPSILQVGGGGQSKPVSLTFLQPQSGPRLAAPSGATVLQTSQASPRPVLAGSKPVAFSLIQAQGGAKVVENVSVQGQQARTVMITKGDSSGQRIVTVPSGHLGSQVVTVASPQSANVAQLQRQTSSPISTVGQQLQRQVLSPASAAAHLQRQTSSPAISLVDSKTKTIARTASKPSMTKLAQQMAASHVVTQQVAAPQVVNVANLQSVPGSAQQKQGQGIQGTTTIKIQGGSILQSQGGKPLSIQQVQRAQSVDSGVIPGGVAVQRVQSVDGVDLKHSAPVTIISTQPTPTRQITVSRGGKPTIVSRGGKPLTLSRGGKPATISRGGKPVPGGKPTTLLITRPTSAQTASKPATFTTANLPSSIAQLIQTSTIGGKPIQLGGKPIIIGGKPIHLGGKPIQLGGKPLQLIGKPGQIGLLQGHQGGLMTVVPQTSSPATSVSGGTTAQQTKIGSQSSATGVAPTLVSQILQTSALQQQAAKSSAGVSSAGVSPQGKQQVVVQTSQAKAATQASAPGSMVLTQLQAGKPGTPPSSQATKILTTAQTQQLLGTQIIVPSTQTSTRMVQPQIITAGGRPTLITTQGGKPGQNIQLVKTMLSQPGSKPAQNTFVFAPPRGPTGVTTVTAAELKSMQAASKSKGGPVYARIITPPPGIRLTTVRPGQVGGVGQVGGLQGVSVIQALPSEAAQILSQLPMGTVNTSQQPAAKPASNTEAKQE